MLFTVTLMSLAVMIFATAGAARALGGAAGRSSTCTDDEHAAVDIAGVDKRFGDLVAVRHLDLGSSAGEFFSIIGPSGCGKTTTLRMVAGFEDPTTGTISVGGRDMTDVRPYRRPVNTVFQSYALFPHLDVFENVAFGLREAQGRQGRGAHARRRGDRARAARGPRASRARGSSPAASSSASRSRARSSTAPRCCCSTSRSARST